MPEIPSSGAKMADPIKSGEATVLEIPVTVQGSRCVDGKEQRELFTETTQTTIVFKNGAVLNLKAKVLAGQCVFLRNDKSGREILCKVQESRPAGEGNYTDLIFTVHDPDFWTFQPEQPAAAAPILDAQMKIDAAVASLVSQTAAESSASVSEEVAPAFSETNAAVAAASDLPEANAAVPEQVTGNDSIVANTANVANATSDVNAASDAHEAHETRDTNDQEDAEHLASLIAMDDKSQAKRESASPKNKEAEAEAASDLVSEVAQQQDEARPVAAGAAKAISSLELRLRTLPYARVLKNPIAIGIAATVLIAVTLSVAWHVRRGHSIHSSNRASAAFFPSKQPAQRGTAQTSAAQPSQAPGISAATAASNTAPTATPNAGNSNAVPAVSAPHNTTAQSAPERQQPGKTANDSVRPSVVSVAASIPGSDQAVLARPKHRKRNDQGGGETIPAKIVSQPQPSVPQWAKGLDTDAVVQLDALIDAKGNVTETRALSGPRMLQREAERVVALWIFEPAMADGKPTATHMVLTVQFQM
jgi:hypothetical protein